MRSRRKVYLINPKFQLKFVSIFSIALIFIFITLTITINYFFFQFREMGIAVNLSQDHIFFKFLKEQQLQLNILFILMGCFSLILSTIGGIFLSHKIAGPLYRFCSDIAQMKKNNLKEIKFRKNDFFPEVANEFNKFLGRIND